MTHVYDHDVQVLDFVRCFLGTVYISWASGYGELANWAWKLEPAGYGLDGILLRLKIIPKLELKRLEWLGY